jgi:hypothetical protein
MGFPDDLPHKSNKKAGHKGLNIGTPWTGARPNGPEHTRTSSNKNGLGPAKPSAKKANPLYAGNKDRSGI